MRCVFASLLLLCLTSLASGTTYYVSTSGLDTNSGTSTGAPWKTVSKVSTGPSGGYSAGDSILFKCGDSWSGSPNFTATLTTPSAGSTTSQITYGTYSTATPSNCATSPPVLDASGSSLSTLMTISRNYITVSSLAIRNAATIINFAGTVGTQIRGNTVTNASNHLFYGGTACSSASSSCLTGTTVIDGNTYTVDSGKAGGNNVIEIWSDPRMGWTYTITNNVLDRSVSNAPNGNCIILPGASNTVISGNTCRGGGQGPGVKPYQHPEVQTCSGVSKTGCHCLSGDPGTSNITISGNYIDHITTAGGADGELIEGEGCSTTLQQTNLTVANNVLICETGTIGGTGSSDAIGGYFNNGYNIFGNVIIGGCQTGTSTTSPRAIAINSSSVNVNIYNNTIVGVGKGPDGRNYAAILFTSGSGDVQNNIISNEPIGISNSGGTVSEDYNILDTNVTTAYSSGVTHGGHSMTNTVPQFAVTPPATANDVKLKSTSPAIGAGANLGSTFNTVLSPAASAFPYGTLTQPAVGAWVIGAFGYLVPLPPLKIKGITIRGLTIPHS